MKTTKFKLCLIAVMAAFLFSNGLSAQVNTPYSMYGYGILGDRATSMQRQMGSIGYAMQAGRQINVMNPASYAAIDSLTFLFDIGADLSFVHSKEGSAKEWATGGGLDYVTMQFPLSKHFGASIGMLPYSSVGYAFGNDIHHGTLEYQGTGGINMAYLGLAGGYGGFSLGFNVSYNFGTIINDSYIRPSGSGEALIEHVMQIRDWDINIGAQYAFKLDRFNKLTAGLTFSPKKTLLGKSWVTSQEMVQESLPDTLGTLRLKDNYYTPNSYGVGINFTHEKVSRLMMEFDVTYQQWSKAKYSALYGTTDSGAQQVIFEGMKFDDRLKIALGAEFVPKIRGSYGQRIAYRLGGYFCNDYLNIHGNRVREYGLTCGVGLRAPQDKTMINLGFEWKHRTTSPVQLIGENYFNITLGVNFDELWFWQRKIK